MDFLTLICLGYGGALLTVFTPWFLGASLLQRRNYRPALLCFRWVYLLSSLLRTWRGPAACYLAATYTEMGDFHLARTYAEEAVQENRRRKSHRFLLNSYLYLGVLLGRQGEFEQAEQVFDEALRIRKGPDLVRHAVQIHAANIYLVRGRLQEAEQLLRSSLAQKLRPDLRVAAQCALGICHYYRNDLDAALACVQPAQQSANLPHWARVTLLSDRLLYLTARGELAAARLTEHELISLLPSEHTFIQQRALRAIAQLALTTGDLDRARDYAERTERLGINPNVQAGVLLIQAEVFAARHNLHRAVSLCDTVLQSTTIHFYKARATALRLRLMEPAAQPALAAVEPIQKTLQVQTTVQTQSAVQETPEVLVLHARG